MTFPILKRSADCTRPGHGKIQPVDPLVCRGWRLLSWKRGSWQDREPKDIQLSDTPPWPRLRSKRDPRSRGQSSVSESWRSLGSPQLPGPSW